MITCICHCSDIPFLSYHNVLTRYLLVDVPYRLSFVVLAMGISQNQLLSSSCYAEDD